MLSLLANVWMIYRISGDLNILRFGLVALRFQGQRLLTEQSTIFFQLFARDYTIYLPLGIWLYRHRAIHAGSLSVVVFIAFTTAATTLTRGPILLCSMSLITAILTFFRPNRWQAVGFALGLVALLGSLTLLLVPDVDALLTISTTYFWGSCPAYERILDGRFPDTAWYDIPLYSLDSLNYALSKFGLIRTYPTLVRPYAPGALTTNVYTYLDAPTLDFGVLGAMVGAAMVGGLAAWLHRKAHRHQSPLVVAYYGFINYAITISFMNNELIRIHAFLLALELWGLQQLITAKTQPLPGSPTNE